MANERKSKRFHMSVARKCIVRDATDLPQDFDKTVRQAFAHDYMYFCKRADKQYVGYCTCGARDVELHNAKGGEYIECPHCKRTVRLKSGRYGQTVEEHETVAYVQRTEAGWMSRIFVAWRYTDFDRENLRAHMWFQLVEEQRDHLDRNGVYFVYHPNQNNPSSWMYGEGKKHGMGWTGWRAVDCPIHVYPNNLNEIFADSEYKYSQIGTMCRHNTVDPFAYLYDYLRHPQYEYLLKLGLYRLAKDYYLADSWYHQTYVDRGGKTLEQICGLRNKVDIAYAAQHNLSSLQIVAYLQVSRWKNISESERLRAIEFISELVHARGEDFEYSFISNERLYAYYRTQADRYDARGFIADYQDYISAAHELKMSLDDTKVKTPRDLRYVHDVCIARALELREQREKIARKKQEQNSRRAFVRAVKKYVEILAYADKRYTVVVPSTPQDLIAEGQAMRNCVGNYVQRVANGTSIVLFLRRTKQPEQSFCTVELRPDTYDIVQCRTYGNGNPNKSVNDWMQRYVKRIRKIMKASA